MPDRYNEPTDVVEHKDGERRVRVDTDVPVVLMPPWANPAYVEIIWASSQFPRIPFSPRVNCSDCGVWWRAAQGTDCFICGVDQFAKDTVQAVGT